MSGLESLKESVDQSSQLTDRQSEAILLLTFIPSEHGSADVARLQQAWRSGDADTVWQVLAEQFRDVPSLEELQVNARNRNWIVKIVRFIRSGKTYFVVVGAGHMGGPQGLLALLHARGCKIEQL